MELFHCLNRGVDGRAIFLDNRDRARFVHDLFEFNDQSPAGSTYHTFRNLDLRNPDFERKPVQKIVDIHGWCLMKNHYHLLLSENIENGISLFLRKLNVGYANYFNERHKRMGTLFQGRTKKIHVARDAHFLYILHYIHLNPLDYLKGSENWRIRSKASVANLGNMLTYLNQYRWSSYLDYNGQRNFPSVLTTQLFDTESGGYVESLKNYLREASSEDEVDTSKFE